MVAIPYSLLINGSTIKQRLTHNDKSYGLWSEKVQLFPLEIYSTTNSSSILSKSQTQHLSNAEPHNWQAQFLAVCLSTSINTKESFLLSST